MPRQAGSCSSCQTLGGRDSEIQVGLLACHECGSQISSEAKRCPQCGALNRQRKKPSVRKWLLIAALVVLVGGFALLEAATSPNFCEGYLGRHTFIGVFDRSILAKQEHLRVVDVISQKETSPMNGKLERMTCEFEFRTNDTKTRKYSMSFVPSNSASGYLVRIKEE